MAHSVDEIEELLEEASLSKWEEDFLREMSEKIDRSQPLTENQQEKLDQIFRDKG